VGDVAGAVGRDAVIVLPGIMGSELVDVDAQRVLWGLADAVSGLAISGPMLFVATGEGLLRMDLDKNAGT